VEPKRIKVSAPAVLPILNASAVPPVSISNLDPSQSKSEFPSKVLEVPDPVITLVAALLFIVVPAGMLTVSKL
tara:strand:+ start:185 stop:403 length:219 start_codon:yes stop_codon:yes gene_type:complete